MEEMNLVRAIKLKIDGARRLGLTVLATEKQQSRQAKSLIVSLVAQHRPNNVEGRCDSTLLAAEIENAAAVLHLSGASVKIACERLPDAPIEQQAHHVLGEAITNIVAHSTATEVATNVTGTGISTINNGCDPGQALPSLGSLDVLRVHLEAAGAELPVVENQDKFVAAVSFPVGGDEDAGRIDASNRDEQAQSRWNVNLCPVVALQSGLALLLVFAVFPGRFTGYSPLIVLASTAVYCVLRIEISVPKCRQRGRGTAPREVTQW